MSLGARPRMGDGLPQLGGRPIPARRPCQSTGVLGVVWDQALSLAAS